MYHFLYLNVYQILISLYIPVLLNTCNTCTWHAHTCLSTPGGCFSPLVQYGPNMEPRYGEQEQKTFLFECHITSIYQYRNPIFFDAYRVLKRDPIFSSLHWHQYGTVRHGNSEATYPDGETPREFPGWRHFRNQPFAICCPMRITKIFAGTC